MSRIAEIRWRTEDPIVYADVRELAGPLVQLSRSSASRN